MNNLREEGFPDLILNRPDIQLVEPGEDVRRYHRRFPGRAQDFTAFVRRVPVPGDHDRTVDPGSCQTFSVGQNAFFIAPVGPACQQEQVRA